jgi:hypothetical protein
LVGAFPVLLAKAKILTVVAGVANELTVLDLVHVLHELVHEIAVMRDHEDGAGVVLQVIAEPH